jgi:hypothetical protein
MITELFCANDERTLDIGPSSSSPFAKELAQLFVHGDASDKQHLSQEEVIEGFATMATAYARRTPSIQASGNTLFRTFLGLVFPTIITASNAPNSEQQQQRNALEISEEVRRQHNFTDLSPVSAEEDDTPPLLRSKTTTVATRIGSRGQEPRDWDPDTESLFELIVADLFSCVVPAAASVSRRELEAIVHAAGHSAAAAQHVLAAFRPLWTLAQDDCLTRDSVRSIFAKASTQLFCNERFSKVLLPIGAYIRRKLRPVIRAVQAKKTYEEGKQYKFCIQTSGGFLSEIRCTLLKRLEVQLFEVEVLRNGRRSILQVNKLHEVSPHDEDDEYDDFADAAPRFVPRPLLKHAFAHLDWSAEAYARDMHFALRAIAADFPRFQLGEKLPKCVKDDYAVTFRKSSGLRMDFDNFDYGISFAPFCSAEFLPSLSADDHQRLMDTAAMRESFRCFFLHLAVELGVHPVALQVIVRDVCAACRELGARSLCFPSLLLVCSTCAASAAQRYRKSSPTEQPPTRTRKHSCSESLSTACWSAVATGARPPPHPALLSLSALTRCSATGALLNNFVDAQFLQAVWPQELDNVRLLIITVVNGRIQTHDWNLFTPLAQAQAAIDRGEHWAGRDVIMKLEMGHFTILKALLPDSTAYREHPIQDLLDIIEQAKGTDAPGERQLLHLESIFGAQPDPARPVSIAQLFDAVHEARGASEGAQPSPAHHEAPADAPHAPTSHSPA